MASCRRSSNPAVNLPMRYLTFSLISSLCLVSPAIAAEIPQINAAVQAAINASELAGGVTVVMTKDKILHLGAVGQANVERKEPMRTDHLFSIASMTKPVTATAILMLQDEGKLKVTDPVAKYLPEFSSLKTPSGKPANLTIVQILTHVSGMGEASGEAARTARTLADLVPLWVASPMQFEPGAQWKYCQSGINAAARIVEVVSGQTFDAFLQARLFGPLGMTDTTHYPQGDLVKRVATPYARNAETGQLTAVTPRSTAGPGERSPTGSTGLFSTALDYTRFCQMLLGGGEFGGRRYLSAEAMRWLSQPQTGDLPTGFMQTAEWGNHGSKYGWGLGTCVLREPHPGVASMLSPGTFGHGGAWGTQAWIDPVRGVAFVLMVQRTNFKNSDASEVRRAFQQAAVEALANAR